MDILLDNSLIYNNKLAVSLQYTFRFSKRKALVCIFMMSLSFPVYEDDGDNNDA